MLKRKFSSNPNVGKAENEAPDKKDEDITENTEAGNEEITGTGSESEEYAESDEITGTVPEELNEEMAILQKELSESQDKYLRLAADFDNYRKRTLREKTELIQTAGESVLRDVLPVVDDFERGLDMASNAENMDAVRAGMELIYNKLKEFLASRGVREIQAMNEPFDTDWHEAVTNIPALSEDMKGKVVDVIQKGYTLNDKVMRYPKVVVGE